MILSVAEIFKEAALIPKHAEPEDAEVTIFEEAFIAPKGLVAPIVPLKERFPPANMVMLGSKVRVPPSTGPSVISEINSALESKNKL